MDRRFRGATTLHGTRGNASPLAIVANHPLLAMMVLVTLMTAMRLVDASWFDMRTDEAYYWTWSKENVLSFLDHPPMIAWFIRVGTAIFGDTSLGVRFAGIVAMAITQLMLADIVRRVTHDVRAVVVAVLLSEAALYYGLFMAKVAPDVALIPFAMAMIWALVRLAETEDGRWWLAAGFFGGCTLLSKYTAVLLLPAVVAFALVPDWRRRWLMSPYPWLGALIAVAVFSPVIIWNSHNDWASFRFQFVRAEVNHGLSLRTVADYLGLQFAQVGPILLPVVLSGVSISAWRGYRQRDPVAILLSTSVIVPFVYFFWRSLTLPVGDTWPMFVWPPGFAAVAINLTMLVREKRPAWMIKSTLMWITSAIVSGIAIVVLAFLYELVCPWNLTRQDRSHRGGSGLRRCGQRHARRDEPGRRHLGRDVGLPDLCHVALVPAGEDTPVIQINERARFIGFRDPGIARMRGHPALYVARASDGAAAIFAGTTAVLTPLTEIERRWRGTTMGRYSLQELTGWTPDLNPPPGSRFYAWPNLALLAGPRPQNDHELLTALADGPGCFAARGFPQ